jgi:hypothetical protein
MVARPYGILNEFPIVFCSPKVLCKQSGVSVEVVCIHLLVRLRDPMVNLAPPSQEEGIVADFLCQGMPEQVRLILVCISADELRIFELR